MEILEIPQGRSRFDVPVSIVRGINPKIVEYRTLGEVLKNIPHPDPVSSNFSKELRKAKQNDPGKYTQLKETKCPGYIIGKSSKRADKNCQVYVPVFVFDVDGYKGRPLDIFLSDLKKCEYIFCAYPSPSFEGFRILIWAESTPETHKAVYAEICAFLSDFLNLPTDKDLRKQKCNLKDTPHIDTGTNNISRQWFYTAVPEDLFYLNIDSQVFVPSEPVPVQKKTKRPPSNTPPSSGVKISDDEKLKICLEKVERQNPPTRNLKTFNVAGECCRHGIPKSVALAHCLTYAEPDDPIDPFTDEEIIKTVNNSYKYKVREFSDEQILNYKKKLLNGNGVQAIEKSNQVPAPPINTRKSKFVQIEEYLLGKYEFRRNIISNEIEFRKKDIKNEFAELNENDLIIELMRLAYTSVDPIITTFLKSNIVPNYDPFKTYFESLPEWDENKPDYIKLLAGYVKAIDQHWFNVQFKKMLVRTLACALNIIPFNKHCFTLVGRQNDGKTSFLRFLCPSVLSRYFKENLDIHNKDGRLALCTNFFINLDELASFSKYDIRQTKGFFTIDKIKERLPYDRKARNFPRRASFLASTNSSEFLTDETGNVRWLVFEIEGINHANGGEKGYNKNIDIDLVWSQAYSLLKRDFNFKLIPEELAKSELNNKRYQVSTIEEELIRERYIPATKNDHDVFKVTSDILNELCDGYPNLKSKLNGIKIGRAMRFLGFEKEQRFYREHNHQRKGYYIKYIKK